MKGIKLACFDKDLVLFPCLAKKASQLRQDTFSANLIGIIS